MIIKHLSRNISAFLMFLIIIGAYASKTYTGTVVPIFKSNINAGSGFSYWGSLKFSARMGTITKPQITDMSGNIVESGSTLISMRQQYWKALVKSAEGEILAATKGLTVAYKNYQRYKKLYPTGASTVKEYEKIRAEYYTSIGNYEIAKADLRKQKRVLKQCVQIAPMEGIVDKVYYSSGILAINPKTIELTELNPIGVKVELPKIEINQIKITTPISIHIPNKEKPIGIYNGYSILCDDGIIFSTKNRPNFATEKDYPEIRDCLPAVKFYIYKPESTALGVPMHSIQQDSKGSFVWKAKDRKFMQPGKSLNPVFKIEKVYVTPGNLKRIYNGFTYMRILKDSGTLELFDIVLSIPANLKLKEGETVSFPPERYNLMPGDKVKVVIGE
jgi:hypothetical protein